MTDKSRFAEFQETVWSFYAGHARQGLSWRKARADGTYDPYGIAVSEIMLQQTQVPRVIPKYDMFIRRFPSFSSLAAASLTEVLIEWAGLGYNRRAKQLHDLAETVHRQYGDMLPNSRDQLMRLPGIGPNTAGAILAYAFNEPAVFIETNIRTVFIRHFFSGLTGVTDEELTPLVARTIPAGRARDWYWALMDYGSHLKRTEGNAARASRTYARQSAFKGSRRQLRGKVLRLLTESLSDIGDLEIGTGDIRLREVLADLEREGLVSRDKGKYRLGS